MTRRQAKLFVAFLGLALLAGCDTPQELRKTSYGWHIVEQNYSAPDVKDTVYFTYKKSTLSIEARNILQRQAGWMKKYPHVKIVIEGHADELGSRHNNYELGMQRADVVKIYLVNLGIDSHRLKTVSYGDYQPVLEAQEATPAKNRRVVSITLDQILEKSIKH